MTPEEQTQITQETLRSILLALAASCPAINRQQLAHALSTLATAPAINAQTRVNLQDLAAGMTAIAGSAGSKQ